jgi:hypothetical protein
VTSHALRRPLWLKVRLGIVVITVIGVTVLYRLQRGARPEIRGPAFTLATRPPALRPPRALALDFGTPGARSSLVAGFGSDVRRDRRTEVSTVSRPVRLAFELAPDPSSYHLTLTGRAMDGGPRIVRLTLNEAALGSIEFGSAFGRGGLDVAPELLISGRNEMVLELDGEVALDRLDLVPTSASVHVNLSSALLRESPSFTASEASGEAPCTPPVKKPGEHRVELRPHGDAYVLGISAHSSVAPGPAFRMLVNGTGVGEVKVAPEGGGGLLIVPTSALRVGENVVQALQGGGPQATLASLTLSPAGDHALLDLGTPPARTHLASGFSSDETCGTGTCVWSSAASSRVLIGLGQAQGSYRLSLSAHAIVTLAPLQVEISVNGIVVGRLDWGSALETREIELAPGVLKRGVNEIGFAYARTAQPSVTVPGSSDVRHLALRYDWIEVFPSAAE